MKESSYPIDALLPDVRSWLDQAVRGDGPRRLLVEAPPGAGKTTRLPPYLLDSGLLASTAGARPPKIVVSEPRRIAARLSATRVASERGGKVGDEVGYRVRFDERVSQTTRLSYETEGLLRRRLLDQGPDSTGLVVLDEVHERSAELDTLLALLETEPFRRLPVIAMSATPDTKTLASFWDSPPCLVSAGRSYPVEITHLPKPDDRPLEVQVSAAVGQRIVEGGSILVFLPGAAEIRRCQEALEKRLGPSSGVEVLPLHGDQSVDDQARALGAGGRRIILSTNIAETSVTLPGVTTVIDTGLARVARHDAISGALGLGVEEIAQARAIQRAGRAGRTAPGVCLRLFTAANFSARAPQETPEILRSDLAALSLDLHASGLDPSGLRFPNPPDSVSWQAAENVLLELGALSEGRLTLLGEQMARLPLPPRLARVALAAKDAGLGFMGTIATALLAERDIVRQGKFGSAGSETVTSDSDLEDRLMLFEEVAASRFSRSLVGRLGLDEGSLRTVDQLARRVAAALGVSTEGPIAPTDPNESRRLTHALFTGFFDRVAERRERSRVLLLSGGLELELDRASAVTSAPLVLVLGADGKRGGRRASARIVHRIAPDDLLGLGGQRITTEELLAYDAERDTIEETSRLRYGKLVLDESRQRARPSLETAKVLARAALSKGPVGYDPEGRLPNLVARLALLARHRPAALAAAGFSIERDWAAPDAAAELTARCLEEAARGAVNIGEIAKLELDRYWLAANPELADILRRELPTDVQLPGGRRLTVHYELDRPPWVESRLQDFFSMTTTPSVLGGAVPLAVHLLAPNYRAVQVTSDLAGFWLKHYPELRRQLMRRYPKHSWPEDGATAAPPERRR